MKNVLDFTKDMFFEVSKNNGTVKSIIRVEDFYKAIKEKLIEDILVDVPNSSHYGKLKEK